MDFEKLSGNLKRVIEIVNELPDSFRDRSFDALLQAAIADATVSQQGDGKRDIQSGSSTSTKQIEDFPPLQRRISYWMNKYGVSTDQLGAFVEFDNDQIHFAKPPATSVKATAQLQWTLLLALENAIMRDLFEVGYDSLRLMLKREECLDEKNFSTILTKHKDLFRAGAPKSGGGPKRLSDAGEKELAELIKGVVPS